MKSIILDVVEIRSSFFFVDVNLISNLDMNSHRQQWWLQAKEQLELLPDLCNFGYVYNLDLQNQEIFYVPISLDKCLLISWQLWVKFVEFACFKSFKAGNHKLLFDVKWLNIFFNKIYTNLPTYFNKT